MKRNNKKTTDTDSGELVIDESMQLVESKLKVSGKAAKFQLEKAEKWLNDNYEFRNNVIANNIQCRNKHERHAKWVDVDLNSLNRRMIRECVTYAIDRLNSLLFSDFVPRYNPLAEYFSTLGDFKADEPDYIEQLANYVKVEDADSWRKHFKKHLVRTVACALEDSYFNKHCLTLIGKQNDGKTTFLRFLTPGQLHGYATENFTLDKDGMLALVQNLFINLDELASLSKFEVNQLKAMFSKTHVKLRPPFEKHARLFPRVATFVGSTNKREFLTDETGSVRWLCFEVIDIDFEYSKVVDINNVWKQAYHLYQLSLQGFEHYDYRLTVSELQENEAINARHTVISPEMDLISQYMEPGDRTDEFMTATAIINYLNMKAPTVKLSHVMVGRAMRPLGFERIKSYVGEANSLYGYYVKTTGDGLKPTHRQLVEEIA